MGNNSDRLASWRGEGGGGGEENDCDFSGNGASCRVWVKYERAALCAERFRGELVTDV